MAIIARDGADLLPLFLRLEVEELAAEKQSATLDRIRDLAQNRRAA